MFPSGLRPDEMQKAFPEMQKRSQRTRRPSRQRRCWLAGSELKGPGRRGLALQRGIVAEFKSQRTPLLLRCKNPPRHRWLETKHASADAEKSSSAQRTDTEPQRGAMHPKDSAYSRDPDDPQRANIIDRRNQTSADADSDKAAQPARC